MTMSDKAAFGSNRFPGQRPVDAAPLSSWPCLRCGRINMALARFCGKCGATREPPSRRPPEGRNAGAGQITPPSRASQPVRIPRPVSSSVPASAGSIPVAGARDRRLADPRDVVPVPPTDKRSEGLPLCPDGWRREMAASLPAKGSADRASASGRLSGSRPAACLPAQGEDGPLAMRETDVSRRHAWRQGGTSDIVSVGTGSFSSPEATPAGPGSQVSPRMNDRERIAEEPFWMAGATPATRDDLILADDEPAPWWEDGESGRDEASDPCRGGDPGSPDPGRPDEDGISDQTEAAPATPGRSPFHRRSRSRLPRSARALWRRLGWKVSLMAVGLFLLLPLLGMATQRGAAGRHGAAPVCWADFQSYLSRHLGITLDEADVLARAAWGAVPQPEVVLTVEQARSVEAVLNQKEEEKIRLVPPTVVGGNLRQEHLAAGPTASAEGRFLDVSLDHPVYLAWAALLKLELPVAGADGQARPYEPVRWDEWGRLLEALSRSAGADERIGRSFWSGRNGDLSGEDLRRSLLEVRSVLGLPIAGAEGNPGSVAEHPTRLEALGALSHILSELEAHASTAQQ